MSDSSATSNLNKQAIDAALNSRWEEAISINLQILELEPENTECLNRLAKAYFEQGEYKQAEKYYKQVLQHDPYNTIAQKNLKKIAACKDNPNQSLKNGQIPMLSPSFFLSEPGLTKSVSLLKVAEPQRILTLSAGMMVQLVPKSRGISVTDIANNYLGVLPDDLAFHLLKLIEGGNTYQAFIQSIKQNTVTILIRETFRSKQFKNQASFLEESKILSYSSDHLTLLADDEDAPPPDTVQIDGDEGSY